MIDQFKNQYRFLSNFYQSKAKYDGIIYPTAEHAFQAAKTNDMDWQEKIWFAKTPTEAKRLGRKAPLREDWEDIKLIVMKEILKSKFSNPPLAQKLLETGDQELIEGNWWGDTFWGVCKGVGENHLGKLLMNIRKEIKDDR